MRAMDQSTATPPATEAAVPAGLLRNLQDGKAVRSLQLERGAINEEARTVTLAFASETPVERWWGNEILECSTAAMRQGRLRTGANLLCDHNTRDVVGVVESVEIGADRIARAVVRFGKSARAEEVWQDVKDGIRRNVSVGYLIHRAVLVEERDGQETYRISDWESFYANYYSEQEKLDAVVGGLTTTLAKYGVQLPTTAEAYRALVEKQMAAGGVRRRAGCGAAVPEWHLQASGRCLEARAARHGGCGRRHLRWAIHQHRAAQGCNGR